MNGHLASETGQPQWDFNREAGRAAMGELLTATKCPPEDVRDRFWLKQVAGIQQWARIRG